MIKNFKVCVLFYGQSLLFLIISKISIYLSINLPNNHSIPTHRKKMVETFLIKNKPWKGNKFVPRTDENTCSHFINDIGFYLTKKKRKKKLSKIEDS